MASEGNYSVPKTIRGDIVGDWQNSARQNKPTCGEHMHSSQTRRDIGICESWRYVTWTPRVLRPMECETVVGREFKPWSAASLASGYGHGNVQRVYNQLQKMYALNYLLIIELIDKRKLTWFVVDSG